MTGAALFAMVGAVLALWPPDPPATAASQTISPPVEPSTAPAPLRGFERLVIYGHSMPVGGGASDPALGYAEVAAELAGLELVNRADGGTVASTSANTMAASPSAGPRDAVVIHTGMNDIFRRGDDAVAMGRGAIERLLAGTAGAKQRVVILECQPPSWQHTPPGRDLQNAYDAWNDMLRDEASRAGGVHVLDTCSAWVPESFTDAPKYHPNDEGHALIAEELVDLLRAS
jgi:lysophospholipase L1-like esterase